MSKGKKVHFFDIDNSVKYILKALKEHNLDKFNKIISKMPDKLNLEDMKKIVLTLLTNMSSEFDKDFCTQAYKELCNKYKILTVEAFNKVRSKWIYNSDIHQAIIKGSDLHYEELRSHKANQDLLSSDAISQKEIEEKEEGKAQNSDANTDVENCKLSEGDIEETGYISIAAAKPRPTMSINPEAQNSLADFIIKNFMQWIKDLPLEIKEYFDNSNVMRGFINYIKYLTGKNDVESSIFTITKEEAFEYEFKDNYNHEKIETLKELEVKNGSDDLIDQEAVLEDGVLNQFPLTNLLYLPMITSLTFMHFESHSNVIVGNVDLSSSNPIL